jgi:hypothetical protein
MTSNKFNKVVYIIMCSLISVKETYMETTPLRPSVI